MRRLTNQKNLSNKFGAEFVATITDFSEAKKFFRNPLLVFKSINELKIPVIIKI